MSVLYQSEADTSVLTKSAPEQVLAVCTQVMTQDGARALLPADQDTILAAYSHLAAKGLRVIGFARRPATDQQITEEGLTFLGLVGLIDPPGSEVRDAIALARGAGIKVVMITGDSPITAGAIADQLFLNVTQHLTGVDLDRLDDVAPSDLLHDDILFARTKPEQKMRIVSSPQAQGQAGQPAPNRCCHHTGVTTRSHRHRSRQCKCCQRPNRQPQMSRPDW